MNRGDRNWTGDLLCIRQVLYQLSYTPITAFQRLALVFIVPCVTLSGLFCLCCYPESEGSLHFSAFALNIRPACRITHQLWSTSGVKELNLPFLSPSHRIFTRFLGGWAFHHWNLHRNHATFKEGMNFRTTVNAEIVRVWICTTHEARDITSRLDFRYHLQPCPDIQYPSVFAMLCVYLFRHHT